MSEGAKKAQREYMKQWRKKNPDKVREYQREWQRKNPDKVKKNIMNYWQRKFKEMQEKEE